MQDTPQVKREMTPELQALYDRRTDAFNKVQELKEQLGKAENELWKIKQLITQAHRKAGQRG